MAKIEDLVKVKDFSTPWHRATINIVYTSNWLNLLLEKRAAAHQITLQQFNALRVLHGQYPTPVRNNLLKERMLTQTPDVSQLVERLVSKGLVSKTKCSDDKRAVDLLISKTGLALLEQMESDMMLDNLLPHHLSAEESLLLSNLLDKFRGHG